MPGGNWTCGTCQPRRLGLDSEAVGRLLLARISAPGIRSWEGVRAEIVAFFVEDGFCPVHAPIFADGVWRAFEATLQAASKEA